MSTGDHDEEVLALTPSGEGEAPRVVAVVVASNPGPWFDESLTALGNLNYPNLAVLVIDAASDENQLQRVAQSLPDAYVRRLKENPGYSAATNRSLRIINGADYLVLCHDDVAPDPGALRSMVIRAVRSDADVVTPKYVEWNSPNTLVSIGGEVDIAAAYVPVAERGELDQGQHDSLSEVFVATGGFLLVKFDFFTRLGGFDTMMTRFGEAIDFTWRAKVAGATVAFSPDARVRHFEATSIGQRRPYAYEEDEDLEQFGDSVLRRRARFRTALKVHSGFSFVVALLAQLASTVGELLLSIIRGDRDGASAAVAAITWNATHWRSLFKAKRQLEKERTKSNKDLRSNYGSLRRRLADSFHLNWQRWRADVRGRDFSDEVTRVAKTLRRTPVFVIALVAVVWLLGSRNLLTGQFPSFAQFMPLDQPLDSLRRYFGIWPANSFGNAVPNTPGHLLLAVPEMLFFGAVGTAQRFLILAAIPFGVWGMRRLTRPLHSKSASLMACVAYASLPLGYDAIGSGRFDALVVFAITPFLFTRILRLDGANPYPGRRGSLRIHLRRAPEEALEQLGTESATAAKQAEVITEKLSTPVQGRGARYSFLILRRLLPTGLVAAVAAAFAPQVLAAVAVIVIALIVGDAITGDRRSRADVARLLLVSGGALCVAVVLLLPAFIGSELGWSGLWQSASVAADPSLWSLLRFQAGSVGASIITVVLLLVAFVPVVVGREWRFRLAVKMWLIALSCIFLVWASTNQLLGSVNLDTWIWLIPAGVALSLNVCLAALSLRVDVQSWSPTVSRSVRLGALIAVLFTFVPVVERASSGTWGLPDRSVSESLSWMDQGDNGLFRALWLGDSEALPGEPRKFGALAGAVTVNSSRVSGMTLRADGGEAQALIGQVLDTALAGNTVELGDELSPYGVRYLVVPKLTGSDDNARPLIVDPALTTALDQQLDLRQVSSDESVSVYENTAWQPALPASFSGDGHAQWQGDVRAGDLFVGMAASDGWQLTVDGALTERTTAGWANSFDVPEAGTAELIYRAPMSITIGQISNATLWLLLSYAALRYLPRRKQFA